MSDWIPVIVAIVGAGGPLAALIIRLESKNDKQHAENGTTLNRIESKVDKVDERLYDHVKDHH